MKALISLSVALVLLTGCLKKDTGCPYTQSNIVAPQSEQEMVEAYLASQNITTATKHSSGMYYEILEAGSGGAPGLCSQVRINYSGKLTTGTVFDSDNNVVFQLGILIEGWKKGLPLIQKGGKIKLYIPPSLGYGSQPVRDGSGNVVIPGNSVLVFDIDLLDFTP